MDGFAIHPYGESSSHSADASSTRTRRSRSPTTPSSCAPRRGLRRDGTARDGAGHPLRRVRHGDRRSHRRRRPFIPAWEPDHDQARGRGDGSPPTTGRRSGSRSASPTCGDLIFHVVDEPGSRRLGSPASLLTPYGQVEAILKRCRWPPTAEVTPRRRRALRQGSASPRARPDVLWPRASPVHGNTSAPASGSVRHSTAPSRPGSSRLPADGRSGSSEGSVTLRGNRLVAVRLPESKPARSRGATALDCDLVAAVNPGPASLAASRQRSVCASVISSFRSKTGLCSAGRGGPSTLRRSMRTPI